MAEMGSTKLFVGNLPKNCYSDDLKALFETIGSVSECDVVKDYAFVHYYDPMDADKALKTLDGVPFNGSNLRIQASHSRVRQKPGMGERGVCYRCGQEGHWSKDCHINGSRGGSRQGSEDGRRRDGYSSSRGVRGGGRGSGRGSGYQGSSTMSDRYHPYDRRPEIPSSYSFPVEYPTYAEYAPYQNPGYPRNDYMQQQLGYERSDYAAAASYLPQTDALGRPTPEYYAQRSRGAAYDGSSSNRAGASSSYMDARRPMPQY